MQIDSNDDAGSSRRRTVSLEDIHVYAGLALAASGAAISAGAAAGLAYGAGAFLAVVGAGLYRIGRHP